MYATARTGTEKQRTPDLLVVVACQSRLTHAVTPSPSLTVLSLLFGAKGPMARFRLPVPLPHWSPGPVEEHPQPAVLTSRCGAVTLPLKSQHSSRLPAVSRPSKGRLGVMAIRCGSTSPSDSKLCDRLSTCLVVWCAALYFGPLTPKHSRPLRCRNAASRFTAQSRSKPFPASSCSMPMTRGKPRAPEVSTR